MDRHLAGKTGENIALKYLQNNGFRILHVNYRLPIGELDIVANKKKTLHFIEVKARYSDTTGTPLEAITEAKIQKLVKLAEWYVNKERPQFDDMAISAIGINLSFNPPEIIFVENVMD